MFEFGYQHLPTFLQMIRINSTSSTIPESSAIFSKELFFNDQWFHPFTKTIHYKKKSQNIVIENEMSENLVLFISTVVLTLVYKEKHGMRPLCQDLSHPWSQIMPLFCARTLSFWHFVANIWTPRWNHVFPYILTHWIRLCWSQNIKWSKNSLNIAIGFL